ncbi:two-component sensor histidine kinase [Betaproteobacteria bacterium]|nr:two-component sensor histidine kinase [Betaproteobacteria bacterium]
MSFTKKWPLLPRSLFARLMLVWLVGISLVLFTSLALFVSERARIGRAATLENVVQEIASNAELLDYLAPNERRKLLGKHEHSRLRLSLRPVPDHLEAQPADHPLLVALQQALPERQPALYAHRHDRDKRSASQASLVITLKLADDTLLTARLPGLLPTQPFYQLPRRRAFISALLALVVGVSFFTWVCVRIATQPLSKLAAAARALGEDPERAPLEPSGPIEVVQATAAFNQMQQRINTHMHERTRILAAISHDLQTPITRLRLRAEMLDDENIKIRIQSDLDAMQRLIREGLDYARSMETHSPTQAIDLNSLLAVLTDEAADMGWTVSLHGSASSPFPGQPGALRRALWNLIQNGVKFGEIVEIALNESATSYTITLRDHGPGLPAEEIERVFEPFYRTEASRNRETGGTGLGLSIARNLLHIQHGTVTLANHPEGGLVATVVLPREGSKP